MSVSRSLVFIPGWGFQASIAREVLPKGTQLIDLPAIKTKSNLIEKACHFIEEKVEPRKTILIGWSLGGLIAIKLCERHPNEYKALILIASTPCFGAQSHWPGISKAHQTIFVNHLERPYSVFFNYYLKLTAQPFQFSKLRTTLRSHMIPKDLFVDQKSYKDILFQSDLRPQFSKIQLPTLLIQGGRDPIVPLEAAQYLQALNPSCEHHTIPAAGHLPFMTHYTETDRILSRFLEAIP